MRLRKKGGKRHEMPCHHNRNTLPSISQAQAYAATLGKPSLITAAAISVSGTSSISRTPPIKLLFIESFKPLLHLLRLCRSADLVK